MSNFYDMISSIYRYTYYIMIQDGSISIYSGKYKYIYTFSSLILNVPIQEHYLCKV